MKKIFTLFVVIYLPLLSNEAEEIIKKVDHNMRGKTLYMHLEMQIKTTKHQRTMEMEIWAEGKHKSFVKIINPSRNRGITFLSLNTQMWQYIPKIERIIKIPPSMMLQKWMGSDITNDDMVKQSSIVDDYHARLLSNKEDIATIELTPKSDAAVVWGKIVTEINTTHYTGIKDIYYDESGVEVRAFIYENVKRFGNYYLPTLWKVTPFDKPDHMTSIMIKNARYDVPIDPAYFRKSALKRFSQ